MLRIPGWKFTPNSKHIIEASACQWVVSPHFSIVRGGDESNNPSYDVRKDDSRPAWHKLHETDVLVTGTKVQSLFPGGRLNLL